MNGAPLPASSHTPARRALHIGAALAIAVAFVGFFVGLRTTHQPPDADILHVAAPQPEHAPRARAYRELATQPLGPNADWSAHLNHLPPFAVDPLHASVQSNDAQQQAIMQRTERRAFSGAPPVVPHPVDQRSAAACLACHGQPTRIGPVAAPQISHAHYTHCTQCHVESANGQFRDDAATLLTPSEFTGLAPAGGGERAWPGAPPTIPHATWMRDNCAACHGPTSMGIRTSHPWRHSCTQCHAPAADFDQADFLHALTRPAMEPAP
jgi:cytochrome c-type protein NapB